jgi:protein-tyrosine kinase
VTLVERAIEKLRRAAVAEKAGMTRPVGALVSEVSGADAHDAAPATTPTRRIHIDRSALREAGYLPEASRDRQFADHYRQIKRPLVERTQSPSDPAAASPRLIMMASALPGDGKTFTSINLALSLATERDVSVVLVDADLPKPHVSRIFGVEGEPGLMEALSDSTVDVESLLLPTDIGSLAILPAGNPNDSATELLASARMASILTRLLGRNPRRIVLFDSPPLLVSSESRALASVVGQIVLVVRSGSTPRQAVLDALNEVGEEKSVSLVLNQGRVALGGYYGYGSYGSYGAVETKSD